MGPEKAMATIAATLKVTTPGGAFVCVVFGETNKLADNIRLRFNQIVSQDLFSSRPCKYCLFRDYWGLLEFTRVY